VIGPNRLGADAGRRGGLAVGLFKFSIPMRLTGLQGVIESEGKPRFSSVFFEVGPPLVCLYSVKEPESDGGETHCEDDCGQTVPQTELYEELDRLPERYRVPLVLCHLEGLTHEQAAQRLRCPVRTVETRLLRGRARLRERLIRRGLVPSAVLAGAKSAASAALPAPWMEATVRAGIAITGGHGMGIGMVSVPAVALAEGVLNAMFLKRSFSVLINSSELLNSHSLTQSSSGETPRGSRSMSNRPKCRRSSFWGSTSTRLRPKGCMSATIATGAVDR
jgi:Sigma-70, region 4